MVTVLIKDSNMSLVQAVKHKDKANTGTLPASSRFKCLLRVNKYQDTDCTSKYLKVTDWTDGTTVGGITGVKTYQNKLHHVEGETRDVRDSSVLSCPSTSPGRGRRRERHALSVVTLSVWMFGLLPGLVTTASVFLTHVLGNRCCSAQGVKQRRMHSGPEQEGLREAQYGTISNCTGWNLHSDEDRGLSCINRPFPLSERLWAHQTGTVTPVTTVCRHC